MNNLKKNKQTKEKIKRSGVKMTIKHIVFGGRLYFDAEGLIKIFKVLGDYGLANQIKETIKEEL
jgi:hypothetical protein